MRWRRALGWTLVASLIAVGASLDAFAGDADKRASDEIKWGYKAARRGYWQEALMRFERADSLTPNQPRILNNLAVTLEALGRYDEARATYERALELAPHDSTLRRNRGRFQEFYTEYVAPPETPTEQAPTPDSNEAADAGAAPVGAAEEGSDANG